MSSAAYLKAVAQRIRGAGRRPLLNLTEQLQNQQLPIELTAPQKYILRAHTLSKDPGAYVLSITLQLTGPLNTLALIASIEALYRRHSALRGRVLLENSLASQIVESPAQGAPISEIRCKDVARARLRAENYRLPYDHARDIPAFSARLFVTPSSTHYLALRFHHVFVDGHSLKVIARDLTQEYCRRVNGTATASAESVASYFDWIITEQLRVGASTDIPVRTWTPGADCRIPLGDDFRTTIALDKSTSGSLFDLAHREKITDAAVWFAAATALSTGLSHSTRTSIQTLTQGRYKAETVDCVGCFTFPVVLTVDCDPTQPFADLARSADRALAAAVACNPEEATDHNPLNLTLLYRRKDEQPEWDLAHLDVVEIPVARRNARSPLQLGVVGSADATRVNFEIGASMTAGMRDAAVSAFVTLCRNVANQPYQPVRDAWIDHGANPQPSATTQIDRVDQNSRARFVETLVTIAAAKLEATAITDVGDGARCTKMTYSELLARCRRLAARLQQMLPPGADTVIGIEARNGVSYIVSCLSVVFAGYTFKPVQTETGGLHHDARFGCAFIIRFGQPTSDGYHDGGPWVWFDDLLSGPQSATSAPPSEALLAPPAADPRDDLFCLITTSGSTGVPKEVPVSYAAFMNRLHWMWDAYPLTDDECALVRTSPLFVDSLWEIFGPLLAGTPLVAPSGAPSQSLRLVAETAARFRVTRMSITPSLIRELLQWTADTSALRSVRVLIVSGEVLSGDTLARVRAQMPDTTVLNLYGSTETAGDATAHECVAEDEYRFLVPVGKPLPGVNAYVVDDQNRSVIPGIIGEVIVTGRCLTVGRSRENAAIVRTGDLAYIDAANTITVTGRADNLVKINGVRVSLTAAEREIERRANGVQIRVVTAESGRLVAVYETGTLNEHAIHDINEQLPSAYRPVWHGVDRFPRTATGKIARRDLGTLARGLDATTQPERLTCELEQQQLTAAAILDLASEISHLEPHQVRGYDNLVRMGLNSMDIVRLIAVIEKRYGARLDPTRVFAAPTASSISSQVNDTVLKHATT